MAIIYNNVGKSRQFEELFVRRAPWDKSTYRPQSDSSRPSYISIRRHQLCKRVRHQHPQNQHWEYFYRNYRHIQPSETRRILPFLFQGAHIPLGRKWYDGGNTWISQRNNKLLKFTGETFDEVCQNGDIPSPRSHHTSYFFSRKYLIIHGGTDGNRYFNDFYLLDCSSYTWNKLIVDYDVPFCLRSYIFWNGGRGFFMTGEIFDPKLKRSVH